MFHISLSRIKMENGDEVKWPAPCTQVERIPLYTFKREFHIFIHAFTRSEQCPQVTSKGYAHSGEGG